MIAGVSYEAVDDGGLRISVDGKRRVLNVAHVILCAGQESRVELRPELAQAGMDVRVIGGAKKAAELDAKRAIDDGYRLAISLWFSQPGQPEPKSFLTRIARMTRIIIRI